MSYTDALAGEARAVRAGHPAIEPVEVHGSRGVPLVRRVAAKAGRMGELAAQLPKAQGERTDKQHGPTTGRSSKTAALAELGLSKQRAVLALLNDKEWSQWSDRKIAEACKVSNHLVAQLRGGLTGNSPSEQPSETTEATSTTRKFLTKHGTEAVAFVLSTNLHRRHLNESQRAMVAVAVERMYAAQTRPGPKTVSEDARKSARNSHPSADRAATALNVSPRLVQEAKRVEAKAAPEVVAAVSRVTSATPFPHMKCRGFKAAPPWRALESPRIWQVSATPYDWRKSPLVGTVAKCPNLAGNRSTWRPT